MAHDIHAVDVANRLAGPSALHPLGTDHLGRDVLARLRAGGLNLALVALIASAVAVGLGGAIGLVAALAGGTIRATLRRLADLVQIMPHLVVAALVAVAFGLTPTMAGLALGLIGAGAYAHLVERLVASALRAPHVLAARAMGGSRLFVLRRHVLPRVAPSVGAYAGSDLGAAVNHYAAFSFLGLGADSGAPDWGSMIYDYRLYAFDRPLLVLAPVAALALAILALHLALDPLEVPGTPRRCLALLGFQRRSAS
ncbi:MAG: ABC transporter permease [Alphaproteobacteria bacterium]|nr:ABC transporter permease [Alphaproteobacteria bacterium]